MEYLDCTDCTFADYVNAPYECPNCGADAYFKGDG